MVQIKQNFVSESKYNIKCPYTRTPDRIVIHNTANDAPAVNEISYMKNNNYEVSYHYAVDDKEIVQGIPENRNAWASGDGHGNGNMKGIHIEICYSLSGGSRFDAAEKNAAEFTAYLLKKYGWGIDKVTKHQDYDGKYCPHRTLDRGWSRFIDMVKSYMGQAEKPATAPVEELYRVRKSWTDSASQIGAFKELSNAKAACKAGYKVFNSKGVVVYEPTATSAFKSYKAQVTASAGLNVRKGPGMGYGIIRAIPNGSVATVIKEENGWGFISDGWVSLDYVKKVNNVSSYKAKVNAASGLNYRTGPGTNYAIKGAYTNGTTLTIVQEQNGWGKTDKGYWVFLQYVKKI